MALASVSARAFAASSPRKYASTLPWSGSTAVPAQALALVELEERVGPGGVDDRQPRGVLDQAQVHQLDERLAEGGRVAEVAAGHDDPVGHLPAQRLQDAVHDRLLAFEAERVDAVDQVDAELPADLLDAGHGVVEVAGDLHGQGPVVEGLGQLAVGDLAGADEDDGPHQAGGGAVDGERGAGVAGAGAGGPSGADRCGRG